jgi:L,D-transpeptidase ErfK/SrfK
MLKIVASVITIILIIVCETSFATRSARSELIGSINHYTVKGEETLYDVARHFDLGISEFAAANPGVDLWVPKPKTVITLPTMHLLPNAERKGIVINLAELRLYYFSGSSGKAITFPIGIGVEGSETPLGRTTVLSKIEKPDWYPPKSIRMEHPELPAKVPAGPDNPMGDHAILLAWDNGITIHGTNKPWSIGQHSSHGCLRMYPEDIKKFFKYVKIGDPVQIVNQPVKLGWHEEMLYLEVSNFPDSEGAVNYFNDRALEDKERIYERILSVAGVLRDQLDWQAIDQAIQEANGVPVPIILNNMTIKNNTD